MPAAGNATSIVSDALGRPSIVTDPLGRETRFGFDAAGNLQTISNASGQLVDYGYDAAWRDYRTAAVYLTLMPVVALLTWDIVPERSRRPTVQAGLP